MKTLQLIILTLFLQGCTVAGVNDRLFAYFKDYTRPTESGDTQILIESTQTQKALWVYSDVYLDIYENCRTQAKDEGYLGAAKVSSDPGVGLTKTISAPSDKPLYFSFGEYHPNVSCGVNFSLTLDPEKKYRFLYNNIRGGCDVKIEEKSFDSNSYVESQNVGYGHSGNAFTMYRKADWRRCRDWRATGSKKSEYALNEITIPEIPSGYSLLYVSRVYAQPTLMASKLAIDGKVLVKIKQKTYSWILVEPGHRNIKLSWPGLSGKKATQFGYSFEEGKIYAYAIKGAATIWNSDGLPSHFKLLGSSQDEKVKSYVQEIESFCKYIKSRDNL